MTREVKCEKWDGEPFLFAHVKRDGIWIDLIKDVDGRTTAWSRQPRNLTSKLEWHASFQAFAENAPPATNFYCEAWVVGGSRDDVKRAMRDHDPRLRVECFAVPLHGHEVVPSIACLSHAERMANTCGVNFVPHVKPDWFQTVDGGPPSGDQMLASTFEDAEGWVLKDGNLWNWRKLKPEETYDLRVIGFTEGRGQHEGKIGALILADRSGQIVGKAGGMTLATRDHMTEHKELWLERIVEVRAQGRGSAGGLSHPRFIRLRDDKTEADEL